MTEAHEDNQTVNIPAWVYRAIAFYLLLTLPWMGWVTVQLSKIDVKIQSSRETAEALRQVSVWRMAELERRVSKLEETKTP